MICRYDSEGKGFQVKIEERGDSRVKDHKGQDRFHIRARRAPGGKVRRRKVERTLHDAGCVGALVSYQPSAFSYQLKAFADSR